MEFAEVPGVLGEIGRATLASLPALQKAWPGASGSHRAPRPDGRDFLAAFRPPVEFPVIAEVKLASPSQGAIAPHLSPVEVAAQYLGAGAAALSVLTEPDWFQGSPEYLRLIRQQFPEALLLMKDFFVDPWQVELAAHLGADAVLVIVALLGQERSEMMIRKALDTGLTPLVEVHTLPELEVALACGAQLIGVNNRNLKTLKISLDTTRELIPHVPAGRTIICESGLARGQDLAEMAAAGCHGYLIGTSLMKTGQPGEALATLLREAADGKKSAEN